MSPATVARRPGARERALKLFIVLQRCATAVSGIFREDADLHELTFTEFEVLEALYHKGPLLLGDVQRKVLLSSGGVTYTVDRLAGKGLVERRECSSDRRARYAALTPKGEALIARVFPAVADEIEECMSVLTPQEQDQATDLLRRLGLSAAGRK